MNYILCASYKTLLFALHLKYKGKKITVVTYNKDLIKFCETENIDCIEFEFIRPKVSTFYQFFKLKKMLDATIKKIDIQKGDTFFLLGKTKGYSQYYLSKELSKKNKGYYKDSDRKQKIYKAPRSKPIFFRGVIMRFLLKTFLGLDIIYYIGNNGDPILGISDEFLKKYNIDEFEPNISSEELIIDTVKNYKNNYKKIDNLLIIDDPLSMVKFDSIRAVYNKIYDLPLKFASKNHPRPIEKSEKTYSHYYDLFKNYEEVPRYVPVELFCNNIRKNVIAVLSTALITASKFQHLKAISLLELVDWYHQPSKEDFKQDFIKNSNNKIIFPKTYEELEELLMN